MTRKVPIFREQTVVYGDDFILDQDIENSAESNTYQGDEYDFPCQYEPNFRKRIRTDRYRKLLLDEEEFWVKNRPVLMFELVFT
jgi:FAD synthase